jgi:predicted MFS family arabinose efflux permease
MNMPVRQSLIANTVPLGELGNAIALNSTAINATRIVGPAVGRMLIVMFGAAGNFLLQAGLSLCMVAVILPMKVPYRDIKPGGKASTLLSLQEGLYRRNGQKKGEG